MRILWIFFQKLLERLQTVKPTRTLSRDSLIKEHIKQKQYSKTASRSRPSSAKSSTGSVSHLSRSSSESSFMIGDSASVASSRISSGSSQSAQRKAMSKPVWESGWWSSIFTCAAHKLIHVICCVLLLKIFMVSWISDLNMCKKRNMDHMFIHFKS